MHHPFIHIGLARTSFLSHLELPVLYGKMQNKAKRVPERPQRVSLLDKLLFVFKDGVLTESNKDNLRRF